MKTSKFHTEVNIPEFDTNTGYAKTNMFLGSCFTENIGNRMADLKYKVEINPFGILYNPVSIANGLEILLQKKEFTRGDLVQANGLFHSFYHHGRFSGLNEKDTLDKINSSIKQAAVFLRNTDFLFLTFGTAWVYRYRKSGEIVSNCHKIPSGEFERERLSIAEIVERYKQLLSDLKELNPGMKIIFTVSPVRHWKDGAVENQRSKAFLLLAIDELISKSEKGFCNYFPAYEIMMDELRDYRYYTEDMIHISETAVNHIWEKFEDCLIEKESRQIAKQVQKIIKAYNHRPFNKYTKEHLNFVSKMVSEVEHIEKKHKYLKLGEEKQYFLKEKHEIEQVI